MLSQRSLRLSTFLFIPFSTFCSTTVISTTVFQLTYLFFSLIYSAVDSFYCIFHLSYCIVHLFFKTCSSLLNISCILLVCASILFLRYCILFTIITLNSFSGNMPISTSLSCSSVFLSWSFIWNIFLCHLILFKFLCLWSAFLRLQDCISWFWCLPLVSEVGPGACAGFLVGQTYVFPRVHRAGFCPSGG